MSPFFLINLVWFSSPSFVSHRKCQFDFQWPQSGFCSVQFYPSNPIRFDFRWNSSLRSPRYFICIPELKSDLKQGILWPEWPTKSDSLYTISEIQLKSRIVKIVQIPFNLLFSALEIFEIKNQNSFAALNLCLVNTRAFDLFFFNLKIDPELQSNKLFIDCRQRFAFFSSFACHCLL